MTCGVLAAFSRSFTLDSPSSLERTNRSNSPASWKFWVSRTRTLSREALAEESSLVRSVLIYIKPRPNVSTDSSGAPRPVVNSKGRRRRPGTKTLSAVLRCDDADFVDFIAKCLIWDPERRLKPQTAMRHPFITGGRSKLRTPMSGPSTASRGILGSSSISKISKLSSSTNSAEATKKLTIGPPTPLTARATRVSAGPSAGMSTSVSTGSLSLSSQRTHRYHLAAATGKLS